MQIGITDSAKINRKKAEGESISITTGNTTHTLTGAVNCH